MSEVFQESEKYAIHQIEKKWQTHWAQNNVFAADKNSSRPPFYVLEMFPYPSGTLHMGHARNYAIGDALARFRWAKGYEVLHPMGWDACGLPAENAALQHGIHPKTWTYRNAEVMKKQCLSLGFSHDWSREIFSCDPAYFRHEQKMFLDFHAHGLAYRKESYVNWDSKEQSVLANEQVVDGRGWRSGAVVEKILLKQWFLKITDFAQELLDDLDTLTQWPEAVRDMQKHWIGQSQGLKIRFKRANLGETGLNNDDFSTPFDMMDQSRENVHWANTSNNTSVNNQESPLLEIFTTRPETLFGATFCAIAWDHPWIADTLPECKNAVQDIIKSCQQRGTSSRILETESQNGALTGLFVQHPLRKGILLPVVVANYVTSDYGTGAIFGCPAHDARDYALAVRMNLAILHVIQPIGEKSDLSLDSASQLYSGSGLYTGDGIMLNSDFLDGLNLLEARKKIIEHCVKNNLGQAETLYRLRDWGIGRQRYWGVPIPIIYCPSCGTVPVPEKDLPVVLPEDVRFDQAGNPLHNHPTWKNVPCPSCGIRAQRETDTFDTFFESSWYFARFCDPHNVEKAFSADLAQHWLPVHQYVGGIEHAVMHLLYARFFTKALKKCGYWDLNEPFQGLFTQGMVCHKTYQASDGTWLFPEEVDTHLYRRSDGSAVRVGRSEKMSKSKCNVVGVTQMVDTYGADAVRLFVLSDTPPQKDLEWSEDGIEGAWRYVRRIWALFQEHRTDLQNWSWNFFSITPISDENWNKLPTEFSDSAMILRRSSHSLLLALEHAMDGYGLNKYTALLRQWSNMLASVVFLSHSAAYFDGLKEDFDTSNIAGFDGAPNGDPQAGAQISGTKNSKRSSDSVLKEGSIVLHDTLSDIWALRESWTYFIQAIAPIMPHLAEEIGSFLGLKAGIHLNPWPQVDESLTEEDQIVMAVQVNGKLRGTLTISKTATQEDIISTIRADTALQKYTQGLWKRTIVVPGRMVSIVIAS